MYYYERRRRRKGSGLFDSIIGAVTSETVKKIASDTAKNVATKALTETGNRVIERIVPRKGKGMSAKSKAILDKYAIPIQDYVR